MPGPQAAQAIVVSVIIAGVGVVFLALSRLVEGEPARRRDHRLNVVPADPPRRRDARTPTAIARGFIVKIFVISVLCRAISAGMKHRNLRAGRADDVTASVARVSTRVLI
jgi:hypothetical protein